MREEESFQWQFMTFILFKPHHIYPCGDQQCQGYRQQKRIAL